MLHWVLEKNLFSLSRGILKALGMMARLPGFPGKPAHQHAVPLTGLLDRAGPQGCGAAGRGPRAAVEPTSLSCGASHLEATWSLVVVT